MKVTKQQPAQPFQPYKLVLEVETEVQHNAIRALSAADCRIPSLLDNDGDLDLFNVARLDVTRVLSAIHRGCTHKPTDAS